MNQYSSDVAAVDGLHEAYVKLQDEIGKVIVGQKEVIKFTLLSIFCDSHSLLVGVPGLAKTLLIQTIANVLDLSFKRIQFTPDLMPSDILGVNIYNTATGEFIFRPGPVFADILLADEINRTPAKTQAALLEAMQEHQVTVDGTRHKMSEVFTVFATQNPVEFEGTYPLPEAQIDRFMMKIVLDYPHESVEDEILDRVHDGFDSADLASSGMQTVLDTESLIQLRKAVDSVTISNWEAF